MRDILYRGLSRAEYVGWSSAGNTQARKLFQHLRLAGKRVVGEEQIFFVVGVKPGDKFLCARQQFVATIDDPIQVNQVGGVW